MEYWNGLLDYFAHFVVGPHWLRALRNTEINKKEASKNFTAYSTAFSYVVLMLYIAVLQQHLIQMWGYSVDCTFLKIFNMAASTGKQLVMNPWEG